jgi:hypothetical protein
MARNPASSRIAPVALGLALVALIVAAGLAPQTGAVPAQSNCQYGVCPAATGLPWWVYAVIALLIVAALATALVLMRRRRTPPSSGVPAAGAVGGPTAGATGAVAAAPSGPAPPYVETPEDVGATIPPATPAPPPSTTAVVAGGAAAAGAGAGAAAATETEDPDIDSLMAELDKISSEILKRPKGAGDKKPPANGENP